ncbi:MAG: hypothetical protein ACUVWX_04295 [Kiritimatiellia bacterium]
MIVPFREKGDSLSVRLPPVIVEKLRETRRRLLRIIWLRGCVAVAATGLLSLLGVMAVDMVFMILARSVRWLLTLSAITLDGFVAFRYLIRPLSRSFSLATIARLVDARHPELEERMSSAVEIGTSSDPEDIRGSERFIAALVEEAAAGAHVVSPKREFTARRMRPYALACALGLVVLIAGLVLWPAHTLRLIARAVAPYTDLGNVYAAAVEVRPGSVTILRGNSLRVEALVPQFLARRVELRRRDTSGEETIERMQPEGVDERNRMRFSITFPAVTEGFRYRIRAASALTGYFEVNAVSRPVAEKLRVRYEYPPYTGLPPLIEEDAGGDIVAVVGTRIELSATFSSKLAQAALLVNGKEIGPARDLVSKGRSQGKCWSFVLEPRLDGTWSFSLKDIYGYENEPVEYRIQAVPDRPPTLTLLTPEQQRLRLRPSDRLPLAFVAVDDFGLDAVEMLAAFDEGAFAVLDASLPLEATVQKGRFLGQKILDLAALQLKGVRTLKLQLRAQDNLPPDQNGPQLASSRVVVIDIDSGAAPLAQQTLEQQQQQIAKTLDNAKKDLVAAQQNARQVAALVAEKDKPAETASLQTHLEAVSDKATKAQEALRDLAEAVRQSAFAAMAEAIQKVPDQDILPAREAAGLLPLAPSEAEQKKQADAMQAGLDRAIANVDRLAEQLKAFRRQLDVAAAVSDLALREDRLAREAQSAASAQPSLLPASWQAQQQQVVEELYPLVAQSAEVLQSVWQQDRQTVGQLLNAARQLAEDQQRMREAVAQLEQAASDQMQRARMAEQIAREFGQPGTAGLEPEQVLAKHEAQLAQTMDELGEAAGAAAERAERLGRPEEIRAGTRTAERALAGAAERMHEAARTLASAGQEPSQGQQTGQGRPALTAQDSALAAARAAVAALENLDRTLAAHPLEPPGQTPLADEITEGRELARALQYGGEAVRAAQAASQQRTASQAAQVAANQPSPSGTAGQQAVQTAARAAQQAAQALQAAARQAAQNLGLPTQGEPSSPAEGFMQAMAHNPFLKSGGGFGSDPEAEKRRPPAAEFGTADLEWVKLKGVPASQIGKAEAESAPREYRDLVKQYFREISRRGIGHFRER